MRIIIETDDGGSAVVRPGAGAQHTTHTQTGAPQARPYPSPGVDPTAEDVVVIDGGSAPNIEGLAQPETDESQEATSIQDFAQPVDAGPGMAFGPPFAGAPYGDMTARA